MGNGILMEGFRLKYICPILDGSVGVFRGIQTWNYRTSDQTILWVQIPIAGSEIALSCVAYVGDVDVLSMDKK